MAVVVVVVSRGGPTPVISRWPFFDVRLEVGPVEVSGGGSWRAELGTEVGLRGSTTREHPERQQQEEEEGEEEEDVCQDVGNVAMMEHINLEVPDLEVARLFYGEGLGLTADPGTSGPQRGGLHVMWYNCGRQQVLPSGGSVVGLVMPGEVAEVAERMEGVRKLLGDVALTHAGGDTLEVVDPYGNTFAVHSSLPYFPRGRRGIAYVQLPCFPGTARHIATFYATRLGARCRVSEQDPTTTSTTSTTATTTPAAALTATSRGSGRGGGGGGGGGGSRFPLRAEVVVGPGQKLVFVEQSRLGAGSREDVAPPNRFILNPQKAVTSLFGGWHLAMYVADFSRTFRAVHHPNRPPFNEHPYRDKYGNLQDALRNRQFRFQDIIATEPGAEGDGKGEGDEEVLLYRISHEIRSLHHPLYGRPLYGRETGFV
ncbi:hypothetical protein VOLCADRAFT_87306 [Volvox carteri f. nagariensis]|uniref:VOC domain-containing protein n=1 Tax=Volvox carteri f. nagariensis TaxID=3068 RepID=D8TKZ9_VOLCA|nr:uncharacterized protein VOLCADRAFT_87306 [Volvox carteri f. nagariensis]EFJ51648.1 hypothetical protein VOLCADRAFT_87306 [Volvox carteri f. nagariensis]|eukprot:XP_002947058.1 hypothetical protein VOLCADRAFT_87306 [Volvox carteri f. nagariensis]